MKQMWLDLLDRVDALSLRERVFLFLSLLMCAAAIADALWLSPAQLAQKQLLERLEAQSAERDHLRAELLAAGQPVDASKAVREEIVDITTRLDALQQEIDGLVPATKNSPALEQVLVQFLRRQEGLTLMELRTLKETPANGGNTSGAVANVLGTGMSRKGLELKIAGPYPELVRYVKTLESALPSLRWGNMGLRSEKQPPELSLQVFVVEAQTP